MTAAALPSQADENLYQELQLVREMLRVFSTDLNEALTTMVDKIGNDLGAV